jgi:hypothetical protein
MLRTLLAVACSFALAGCSVGPSAVVGPKTDIAKVLDLKAGFGPEFTTSTVAPTGIDPRLLAPRALPPGAVVDPAGCTKVASGLVVPPGTKGNMAATTAEGKGNRFIVLAVETSEPMQMPDPGEACRKVAFAGGGARGLVEVVDSPVIDGVRTLGTHREVQSVVDGKPVTGELYNYVASFSTFMVVVTANPLVVPGQPVAPVDTQRARDLLSAAVAAVRGT